MNKKILLAEDEKDYATVLRNKLQAANTEVEVAGNGAEALNLVQANKPALVVLDLIMPIKNGFEVLKEIREDNNLKDIKVIVLSNLGQVEDIEKARQLGAVDYIIKSDTTLADAVKKILSYL